MNTFLEASSGSFSFLVWIKNSCSWLLTLPSLWQKYKASFRDGLLLNGIYSQSHFYYLAKISEAGILDYFINHSFRRTHERISGFSKVT